MTISTGELEDGILLEPTVLKGHNGMRVFQEEIFGPVLAVTTFTDEADAVRDRQRHPLWPRAGVWTRNGNLAYRMGRAIKAGRVWTNCYHLYPAGPPSAATRSPGVGRENHQMMLEHYSQTEEPARELQHRSLSGSSETRSHDDERKLIPSPWCRCHPRGTERPSTSLGQAQVNCDVLSNPAVAVTGVSLCALTTGSSLLVTTMFGLGRWVDVRFSDIDGRQFPSGTRKSTPSSFSVWASGTQRGSPYPPGPDHHLVITSRCSLHRRNTGTPCGHVTTTMPGCRAPGLMSSDSHWATRP